MSVSNIFHLLWRVPYSQAFKRVGIAMWTVQNRTLHGPSHPVCFYLKVSTCCKLCVMFRCWMWGHAGKDREREGKRNAILTIKVNLLTYLKNRIHSFGHPKDIHLNHISQECHSISLIRSLQPCQLDFEERLYDIAWILIDPWHGIYRISHNNKGKV